MAQMLVRMSRIAAIQNAIRAPREANRNQTGHVSYVELLLVYPAFFRFGLVMSPMSSCWCCMRV